MRKPSEMTEHDIEINAMDAARREIGAAMRQLDKAAGMLEGCEKGARLAVIVHQIREIDRELYKKIHPPFRAGKDSAGRVSAPCSAPRSPSAPSR